MPLGPTCEHHLHVNEFDESLFGAMNELVPARIYPPGVIPIPPGRIKGTAFFPGGSGLWLENRDPASVSFPVGGVMVLGHNFDSQTSFKESVSRGEEKLTSGTWGPLVKLLSEAGVPLAECFFTNAFMGLCEGDDSFDYRGRDHEKLRLACKDFLRAQIEIQRPRLILTLGLYVPPFLCEASKECAVWTGRKVRLSELDAFPVVRAVEFSMNDGSLHQAAIVPLAHPSLPNNGRRRPDGYAAGRQGEVEIVRAGWQRAF
jgi:hypothetical protein